MGEAQSNHEGEPQKSEIVYAELLNPAVVEEQPFYYKGISVGDYQKELAYLNQNLTSFIDGSYVPLWKQSRFR